MLCLLAVVQLAAQDVSFYASVSRNPVATGETLTYTITLENGRGNISAPDLSDLNVVFGPSTSSNFRIINGRQTSSMTLSYTMRPMRTGKFTIGSASVVVEGKRLTTDPIEVEVTRGTSQSNRSGTASGNTATATPSSDSNLLVQVQLSKRKVYLGEEILATFVILTRYRNLEVSETNFPALPGFWSEEVKMDQASWEREYTMIDGVPYRKAVIRRQVLFPQRTGRIEIPPLDVTAVVNRSFFQPGTEIKVKSNAPTVTVMPLPEKAPESYDGAVGDYEFTAELDRVDVPANEAINLKLTISGRGNLTLVNGPKVQFPADFEAYDPETKDRINVGAGGVRGSRSFQYLIIPRYPGDYEIPEIKFSFFNPSDGKYQTITRGPFNIHVSGTPGEASSGGGMRSQNIVKQSNEDIRYIETDAERLKADGSHFFGSPLYFVLLVLPFVIFAGFVLFRKKREADAFDVEGTRKRKATRMARKRLKSAAGALKSNDSKLFYAEIFKALYGYLSDKLGIPGSLLSRQVIADNLRDRGVDEDLIHQLTRTLEDCEMARFSSTEKMGDENFYSQTVKLITKLDSKIK